MIYIDMDGVIADFDQAIINRFGEEYSNKIADQFWKKICVEAEIFRRMPEITEGMNMVQELKQLRAVLGISETKGVIEIKPPKANPNGGTDWAS